MSPLQKLVGPTLATSQPQAKQQVNEDQSEPEVLLHTDQLSASSRPLLVQAEARRSVLAASSSVVAALPRLEVLDLEVSKSSATLTWRLALNGSSSSSGQPELERGQQTAGRLKRQIGDNKTEPLESSTSAADLSKRQHHRNKLAGRPTTTTTTGAPLDLDHISLGRRLQLARLQSLPAPSNHRRPPTRSSAVAESKVGAANKSQHEEPMVRVQPVPINRLPSRRPKLVAAPEVSADPLHLAPDNSTATPEPPTDTPRKSGDSDAPDVLGHESSSSTTAAPEPEPEPSRWNVRLRKFGSNELDIVKVVANKLHHTTGSTKPAKRHITFTRLEPETGYELCVESASPNQQLADEFQILDANHFLKCQDSTDVELSERTPAESTWSRRSDSSPVDSKWTHFQPTKSLCREFFTLSASTNQTLTLGPAKLDQPEAGTGGGGQRRAKSLGQALRSHTEVLEISDLLTPSWSTYEASGANARLSSTKAQLDQLLSAGHPPLLMRVDDTTTTTTTTLNGTRPSSSDLLKMSALPALGSIFALVFLLSLVNLFTSSVQCRRQCKQKAATVLPPTRSSWFSQRRRRRNERLVELARHQQQALGSSFYSDSDHSAGSQTRMVIGGSLRGAGKDGFANASAYFEVPPGQSAYRSELSSPSEPNNLLAERFHLGPSFEGDGKHNADMVGLARKNYDNIISNIYNADPNGLAVFVSGHEESLRRHRHRTPTNARQAPAQQPSPASGGSGQARHRLRFDKINPIYNMEAFESTGAGSNSPNQRLSRSAGLQNVSTFANSNNSLAEARTALDDDGSDDNCPMCQQEAKERLESDQPCSALHSTNSWPDEKGGSSSFTCCLDRQKQRFEKQQQQLERVMTKNGSLVPQPFINPPEPISGALDNLEPPPDSEPELEPEHDDQVTPRTELERDCDQAETVVKQDRHEQQALDQNDHQEQVKAAADGINKTDFDQRRKELASKLCLVGMANNNQS